MTPERQKERARAFIDAIDRADEPLLAELTAEKFVFELITSVPGMPQSLDRAGFLDSLTKMIRDAVPSGFNFKVTQTIAEGPHVSMQGTSDTVTATGKKYANRYHWYFHFSGDKIDRFHEYTDSYGAFEAFRP